MCWASGYQTDRQLKWTSNASTRWQYGPETEILLGEIPIPAETQVLLEECLGTTCQTVVTLINTLALAPEDATMEVTTAASPEGVEILCFLEPSKPGFHCAASGYAHGSLLLWESNVSGEAESDFYEVTFTARHQLVAEILVTLKECLGVDCQTIETSIDSSVLSDHGPYKPELQNLVLSAFGPYDPPTQTSGDMEFNHAYFVEQEDSFPPIISFGQAGIHVSDALYAPEDRNGYFEIRVPSDTLLYAPVDGVVKHVFWHDSEGRHRDWDDWAIIFKPLSDPRPPTGNDMSPEPRTWLVEIDHVVSLDCPRPRVWPDVCKLPLVLDGQELTVGSTVRAGQILGYAGNLSDLEETGINGRFEIGISQTTHIGGINYGYCPMLFLADNVRSSFDSAIEGYMDAYETWVDDSDVYDEDDMVAPLCQYAWAEYDGTSGGERADATWFKELDLP